ncbi:MAG: alkaline phosphatase family protein [Acidobacteriota bacterium]
MRQTLALLSLLLLIACSQPANPLPFKVVVLGFDGVDPDLVRQWIDRLPHIRSLAESGTLSPLGTTNPPESPVAWASFATGLNPGKHGIFDFLKRDPETYIPDIGLVDRQKASFLFNSIPLGGPKLTNNRKGVPFWKVLDERGIATVNLRVPLEFPPQELDHGRTLSGLGVSDVRDTWGTYFYLATDLSQWDLNDTEFGGRQVKLEMKGNKARAQIDGPVDPRKDDYSRVSIPLELELDENASAVTIRLQGQEEKVAEGRWSDWFRFQFPIGSFVSVKGISRFYVLETFPEVRLYLMPIGLDPEDPPLTFTSPDDYSQELVSRFGLFKTLGWIHETWGLNEEQIDEEIFLEDLFRNMNNLEAMLLDALERKEASLYTAVFTATDSVSHMFYRLIDPEHPRYDKDLAVKYGDAIQRVYEKMDFIIGEVLEKLGDRDVLLVVSDHGFHTWRKEFNTNTWLVRNGFMSLKGMEAASGRQKLDQMFSGGSFFPNVDWGRTKAYSLGLGQIYINLKGREGHGIVEPGEDYQEVVKEIRSKILEYRDPDNGEPVLANTYSRQEIYKGPETEHAGDIQLSFRSGYRTSWQTALGAAPENILVANLKKWSGDHCSSDVSDTGGFLVSNRKVAEPDPAIVDVAPTLYRLFKVEVPEQIDGKALTLAP